MSTTATVLHKQMPLAIKAVNKREIEFVASHELIDADGEVIVIAGIDLTRYARNPIMCLQHDHRQPVARTVSLVRRTVEGYPALVGKAFFPPDDVLSEETYRKIQSGLLGAVSIGFISHERGKPMLPNQVGVTHTKSELLEISVVSLPSCPSCLITAKAKRQASELITFEERDLAKALSQVVNESITAKVRTATRQAIAEARGRID